MGYKNDVLRVNSMQDKKKKTIVLLFLYKNKAELVPEQSSPLLIL